MDGVQLPQGLSHFEEAVYFLPQVPRNSWYSLYQPRKAERLSRPWSHPMVLNTGPLEWESSALTTMPLLRYSSVVDLYEVKSKYCIFWLTKISIKSIIICYNPEQNKITTPKNLLFTFPLPPFLPIQFVWKLKKSEKRFTAENH